jgi:Flp pilus assembly protein TadG
MRKMSATQTQQGKPATEKQLKFFNTLLKQVAGQTIDAFAEGLTTKQASQAIDALLDLKKTGKTGALAATIYQAIGETDEAQAAPTVAKAAPVTLTATGEPALVGRILHIPYADSCATYKVTGIDGGFAVLVKATTADPTMKVMDDWTHPLLGVGPTRIEITSGLIGMAQ